MRAGTDTASEQDAATADAIEPTDVDATDVDQAKPETDAEASSNVVISGAEEVDSTSSKSKRFNRISRVRWPWGRSPSNDLTQRLDNGDDALVSDEAEETPNPASPNGDRGTGEVEPVITDTTDNPEKAESAGSTRRERRISWPFLAAYAGLPALALLFAVAAGFLKWQDASARASQIARVESIAAAKESTIALLSYKSDSVEKDLDAAKGRLTGAFQESYSQLINDVVIPGAKRAHISTTATIPAAALVSATPNHAVTLLFVNQTAVIDKDPPADTQSSVRVTLDKIGGRWLISGFDPV